MRMPVGGVAFVSVCPGSVLSMRFNISGEYRPCAETEGTCNECGLCLKVCPFNPDNPDQDALAAISFSRLKNGQYSKEAGCFVGWAPDPDVRLCGASGGIVTWLLGKLLEEDKIDYVITVHPEYEDGLFFRYLLIDDVASIHSLFLSRNAELNCHFAKIAQLVTLKKVIESQQGVIRRKRLFLERKLAQAGRQGRSHLSLIKGWRFYFPQNWLRWKFLSLATSRADSIDDILAGGGTWFTRFQQVFNNWQKVEKNFARTEKVMGYPRKCARLVLRHKIRLIGTRR